MGANLKRDATMALAWTKGPGTGKPVGATPRLESGEIRYKQSPESRTRFARNRPGRYQMERVYTNEAEARAFFESVAAHGRAILSRRRETSTTNGVSVESFEYIVRVR